MDLSADYVNADHIPGGADYPARWAAQAAAFRARHPPQVLAYGRGERQALDLFLPATGPAAGPATGPATGPDIVPAIVPAGLLIIIHGGYWMRFHRHDWSHLAAGPLARGWAVALPSYDLCPTVRIGQITRQVRAAVILAAAQVQGPIVITGHSAGGHLAARMACADMRLPMLDRVARVVPISALSNLAPLMATQMNDVLRIDPAEAAAESPLLHPKPTVPVTVWVGAAERPAFLAHSQWLARGWDARLVVDPGRHHFDVVAGLERADSALCRALLEGG